MNIAFDGLMVEHQRLASNEVQATHNPSDTPRRNKNSTPLARSYISFCKPMWSVRLGVKSSIAERGNSHCDDVVLVDARIARGCKGGQGEDERPKLGAY